MEKKLKWNAIGLKVKSEQLVKILIEHKSTIPKDHSKKFTKCQNLIDDMDFILNQINQIEKSVIPDLENRLR